MQVVLLHFVTGFMPWTAEHAWPPLRVLFDGHTAVYVFFLISGTVLTPSFAREGAFTAKLAKRVVRLGIPVTVAAFIATLLLAVLPDAHVRAAALTGSAWLAADSPGAPTFAHYLREVGLDSLLLGYREATLFAPVAAHLPPMQCSLDAPFWSLHLELYGSLLVLCLVWLRARSRRVHRAALLASALAFATHPMFLFVIGHLISPLPQSGRGLGRGTFGILLLILGVVLCAAKGWPIVELSRVALCHRELACAPNLFQFQSQLGAIALYAGVLCCPFVWPALQCAACQRLGRLLFSIYLLHFPILFSVVCLAFVALPSIAFAFVLFIALTLLAAVPFERWIDCPAIALSRRATKSDAVLTGAVR